MKRHLTKFFGLSLLFFFLTSVSLFANDVRVTNVTLTGDNPNGQPAFTNVQFNLSWKNSWRDAGSPSPTANWDAVWIFVKFRDESGFYRHATLSNNAAHHNGQGYTVMPSADGKGAFIYRSSSGSGEVNLSNVSLRWNYGVDMTVPIQAVTMQVFAVEMVYIPQGSFFVGDSTTTNVANQFCKGGTIEPFEITSEDALTLGGSNTTNLSNRNNTGASIQDDFSSAQTRSLPAAFPKGFRAFYVMKYEVTFGQIADFYNTLTPQQVTNLTNGQGINASISGARTAAFSGTVPNITTNRPDRPIYFSAYDRSLLYLAWSGLRPMTELEFEKACRGPEKPFPGEFAWGNASAVAATSISGNEDGTETISNSQANSNYGGVTFVGGDGQIGTLRSGIFARSGTGRTQSGSSYYGVMELSGNVWEACVMIGNTTGRAYTGIHGSGAISPSGTLTGPEASEWSTSSNFARSRGGDYSASSSFIRLRVSDRNHNFFGDNFRGVRTAP
ncbi:MAG: SUMF1/EgtB/PvdO family nonheme iron enzyme [Chloroherpetonaceae bacterium]|nr:SUMF1/EgtB/PvdO family nonheme iron enzyme [Chloroherpetonaceae bacterium]